MRSLVALSLSFALIGAAYAAEPSPQPSPAAPSEIGAPRPQTQSGIAFIAGGVGDNSQDAMRSMAHHYNLRLTFVQKPSGQYLADIGVTLQNAHGKTLVDTNADGPFFYAQLPPGHYKISATSSGQTLTRDIDVPSGHAVNQSFYWPRAS